MKIAKLTRGYLGNDCTIGILQFKDVTHDPIYTLENPWLNNKRYVSCIPKGDYHVAPFSGNKYKNVYEVIDVEGRSHILFHAGNIEMDTKGCILPGLKTGKLQGHNAVLQSRKAMDLIHSIVKREPWDLEIR